MLWTGNEVALTLGIYLLQGTAITAELTPVKEP